jgi:hypothetical protein
LRAVLVNEERRGRVERKGDRWRIVADAFPPEVLQAVALLDGAGSWSCWGPGLAK